MPNVGSDPQEGHRCGTVTIIGRPNVGKSTLMNRLLGEKVSIVSAKPETTRDRILGILTLPHAQILFMDTPGIYKGPRTPLGKHQIRSAREAMEEANVLLLMTEAIAGVTDQDLQLIKLLPRRQEKGQSPSGRVPVILAINKVDRIEKGLVLPQMEKLSRAYPFLEIFPISATRGENMEPLLKALVSQLPEGPALHPPDEITDRPMRDLAKDIIREKALIFTHEEVPHAVAVEIEEWRQGLPPRAYGPMRPEAKGKTAAGVANVQDEPPAGSEKGATLSTYIRAVLYVERESQKGILIGKGGLLLKKIGMNARQEIQKWVEGTIYLDLWVKVAPNWRKDPVFLRRMGYS